jgi:hypothetical protein
VWFKLLETRGSRNLVISLGSVLVGSQGLYSAYNISCASGADVEDERVGRAAAAEGHHPTLSAQPSA